MDVNTEGEKKHEVLALLDRSSASTSTDEQAQRGRPSRGAALWADTLSQSDIPASMRSIITSFFAPDSIDPESYLVNEKVIDNQFVWIAHKDHPKLSPSALELAKEGAYIPPGYPAWFVYGYPDVFTWWSRGDGADLFSERYEHLPEDEVIEEGRVKRSVLREMIDLYKKTASKQLEAAVQ